MFVGWTLSPWVLLMTWKLLAAEETWHKILCSVSLGLLAGLWVANGHPGYLLVYAPGPCFSEARLPCSAWSTRAGFFVIQSRDGTWRLRPPFRSPSSCFRVCPFRVCLRATCFAIPSPWAECSSEDWRCSAWPTFARAGLMKLGAAVVGILQLVSVGGGAWPLIRGTFKNAGTDRDVSAQATGHADAAQSIVQLVQRDPGCGHRGLPCFDFEPVVAARTGDPTQVVRLDGRIAVQFLPSSQERLLLISEMYRPSWRADSGDAPLRVERLFGALIGVRVPSDIDSLVLSYRPTALVRSAWISHVTAGVSLLVVAALWFGRGRRAIAG